MIDISGATAPSEKLANSQLSLAAQQTIALAIYESDREGPNGRGKSGNDDGNGKTSTVGNCHTDD